MYWSTGGHMGLMGLWWIVGLAAIIAAAWFGAAGRRRRGEETSAEEKLKERYADGKIDRATFERMLADIRR
jgi:uncharacterized membrane protein